MAVIVGVCALLLVAVYTGFRLSQDPDEVTVDLHASWTPQRNMTVSWQIGALISGERFTVDDVGQFNLTLRVPRGTELVVLAEQGAQGGLLICHIAVAGQSPVTQTLDSNETCRVEAVA